MKRMLSVRIRKIRWTQCFARIRCSSASSKVDVGRKPVWQWLVQGRTGGSKQLTTEGKVADQARPNGLRSTDSFPERCRWPAQQSHKGFLEKCTSPAHHMGSRMLGECECLHETNDTAVSLGPHVMSRGITHPHKEHHVIKRWERPTPIPVSANKTQNLLVLYPSARWRPTTGHSTLSFVTHKFTLNDSMSFGACA